MKQQKNRPFGSVLLFYLCGPEGLRARDVNENHKGTGGKLQHSFRLFAWEAINQQS